jgi:hypothetical protein
MSNADATAVFENFKAASGAMLWDDVHSLRERGTLSAAGMSGEFHALRDVRTGRYASRHRLGSIDGGAGYDGCAAWQRGPSGEIAVLDAPEAKRRARSQAWIDARAYWYPRRMAATYGKTSTCELDGRAYRIIEVVPADGDPLTLWFETDTHFLARIVRRRGADTVTTLLDDYRDVDGLRLPFRSITDRADAGGTVDPRQRVQTVLDEIVPNVASTDADFAVPTMAAVARIDDPSGVTSVRFDLVNNHIYVDADVDGTSVRLMVDTGGANLLTPAAARRLGLSSEGKLVASGPGEQRVDVALAHAGRVRVGTATLDHPVFYVIDLGQLPKAEGVEFDGLIGYEMFRRFGVQIDYANEQLVLSEPEKFVPPAGAAEIEFEFDRLTPIVSGILDGVPVRLTVDTGSRASLTMSSPFVRAHGLVAKYDAPSESILGWGIGGPVRMRSVRFGTLQLGGLEIGDIAGDLFTGTQGALTNPDHAGNLGGGVLKRFTVAFDYAARRMYLAPNANFATCDAFDRSGLWLIEDGEALNVVDVAQGSAAMHADIRENDRLVAIGNEKIATRTLADWRRILRERPVGTELAVRLLREDSAINVNLVLADRIPSSWNGLVK